MNDPKLAKLVSRINNITIRQVQVNYTKILYFHKY